MTTAEQQSLRARFPYKMKDLCELTGLARQAIHFYIQQGLLPAGEKTGRNMAFYGPEHLDRLKLIKRLQHERFLPLKAIKAMLDGREESFSKEQRAFLEAVRTELGATLARGTERERALIDPAPLIADSGVTQAELEELVELGIVGAARGEDGSLSVAVEDTWVIDYVGRLRAAGFTRERGFDVSHLSTYAALIDQILERDVELIGDRLSDLSPDVAARMLERAVPLIHEFLTRRHARRVNDYLSSI